MSKAVGLIETIGLAAAIEAADAAVKAANVTLLGYENTRGSGKITVKITGGVGAVQAGVAAAVASASRVGEAYGKTVMPRPHDGIASLIHNIDRGPGAPSPPAEESPPPPPAETEGSAVAKEPEMAEEAPAPEEVPDAAEEPPDEPTAAAPDAEPDAAEEKPADEPAAAAPDETPDAEPDAPADVAEEREPDRCIAMTRSGERCKLPALEGSAYCFVHRKLEEESE